ncbi:uroporphyrin-III C-methyltransferase [Friedmanniella luteola]|uniref:uroporphyrinogen-III C-methyltransferase n=1 Tax=Friedmanniella luteola TaxID=546871 RepID=A0A1H2A229_9ACTN|nr:uroporphyrin-III C-methyltransferase [Friedmanniella luteola]
MTRGFVADLDLAGRRVVVRGGRAEALAPVTALLEAGADVTVVSDVPGTTIADLADRGLLTVRSEGDDGVLDGAALLVPATGDPDLDADAARRAAARGVLAVRPAVPLLPGGDGRGEVVLVGGGPGDPGLLTVAGLEAVRTADVLVVDRLAPLSVLQQVRPGAEVIDVAKIPRGTFTSQERINELLVEHGRAGRRVVRLKGGDNFVFGRGGEEWQACAAAGIPVRVVPGVSSAIAAPALAGIPLTHRQLTQGFTVVSGHLPPGDPGSTLDWAALARAGTTLVVLMGVATLPAITAELVAQGMAPGTPAATVADAGLPSQRDVRGRVDDIAALTLEAGIRPPAITVIGAVAGFRP